MYYSSGNYEAFARPRKPAGVERKRAWFVGAGLASLSSAMFMIRDGQMPGSNITILERLALPGGALDGIKRPDKGFVIRGGREMEEHFECLWDCFRSVPSLEIEGASVLDEFYWLNKYDPNVSRQRVTENRGQDAHTDGRLGLNHEARHDIMRVCLATRDEMEGKRINEVFGHDFLQSNFWLYWRTMFAFEEWHSALEMKLYLHRFVHQTATIADFSGIKFTRYNQYESLVLPLTRWLMDQGVTFRFCTEVTDIDFSNVDGRKQATRIHWVSEGSEGGVPLRAEDLLLVTIGSLVDNSDEGDHHTPARLNTNPAPAWELWKRIARKGDAFGHPEVFCSSIPETKWESATVTVRDARIVERIRQICKRDPFSGHVVTGGIVTARDSNWLMSWTFNRQPHFKEQRDDEIVGWIYGLFPEQPGNYVNKPMERCTGEEITAEWLYHIGVAVEEIGDLAAGGARCVPCMMPYVTSFFMPRRAGDRPAIVPEGAVNFAFIGQFAETSRDTIFTTEYSVRTGMEAAYQLLEIDRGVPEPFASTYDVRFLLQAASALRDERKLRMPGPAILNREILNKLGSNEIGALLEQAGII